MLVKQEGSAVSPLDTPLPKQHSFRETVTAISRTWNKLQPKPYQGLHFIDHHLYIYRYKNHRLFCKIF